MITAWCTPTQVTGGTAAGVAVRLAVVRLAAAQLAAAQLAAAQLAAQQVAARLAVCLLYTSPSPRDRTRSRMPSSA